MERSTYWMQWVLTAPETGPRTAADAGRNGKPVAVITPTRYGEPTRGEAPRRAAGRRGGERRGVRTAFGPLDHVHRAGRPASSPPSGVANPGSPPTPGIPRSRL